MKEKINWIKEQHWNTNHMYDKYLPYEFHLRMVVNVANKFMDLIIPKSYIHPENPNYENIILSAWGHDLIEDTRTSYNDVGENLGFDVAEIVYALTNEKGKNRKERGNDKYYEGIRTTENAVFVKLCDRIANVQYSKMTQSRMFQMYKKENEGFMEHLGYTNNEHPLEEMFQYLIKLFEEN